MAAARPIDPTNGAPSEPPASEPPASMPRTSALPSAIGPYAIEGVLGSGGMGSVYAAVGPAGEPVALKVVRGSLGTAEALRRFEREASVRIDHPNVVRVLDAATDDEGQPFIALERLEGQTLAERLKDRGALPVEEVYDLAIQAARGLEAAHAAGVVHRDLKPSNLFCCSDGTLKLLDFGVAALQSAETRLTQTGQVVGTLYYLSPEQAERSARVDQRSDVWSLGALTYEAAVGRPPFCEETAMATVLAVMMAEPARPSTRNPSVPRALEDVLLKALAKGPEHRWQSAEQMRAALERARDAPEEALAPSDVARSPSVPPRTVHVVDRDAKFDDATQLGTPITVPPPAAPVRARRWPAAVAAASLALSLAGGAAWWVSSAEPVADAEEHGAQSAPRDPLAAETPETAAAPPAGSRGDEAAPLREASVEGDGPIAAAVPAATEGDTPPPTDEAEPSVAAAAERAPDEPSRRTEAARAVRPERPVATDAPAPAPERAARPAPPARLRTSWDDTPSPPAPADRPDVRGW